MSTNRDPLEPQTWENPFKSEDPLKGMSAKQLKFEVKRWEYEAGKWTRRALGLGFLAFLFFILWLSAISNG